MNALIRADRKKRGAKRKNESYAVSFKDMKIDDDDIKEDDCKMPARSADDDDASALSQSTVEPDNVDQDELSGSDSE